MSNHNQTVVSLRAEIENPLENILIEGARSMLQTAIEAEVAAYIDEHSDAVDENNRRLVVRNGFHPKRNIQTGLGSLSVRKPKVNDKRIDENGERMRFSSCILPAYLRRTKAIEELLPWLYLRGISTGDFNQALAALLGENAPGLSATTITRLKADWNKEYETWKSRKLDGKRYVYIWADGIYVKVRLGDDKKSCLLVIIGVTEEGDKELLAIEAGQRESKLSWTSVFQDLISRGLSEAPKLAVGDGALGFWGALDEVFPQTQQQRCWVHKTANVLNKLPKSLHSQAKGHLIEIYKAPNRKEAERCFDLFIKVYQDRYEKAVQCLKKDREELLSFYNFPAAHWIHLRSTNPIESVFATVRLRTKRTKGAGNVEAALTMVFKLIQCASKKWLKIKKAEVIQDVISEEFKFVDGERVRVA